MEKFKSFKDAAIRARAIEIVQHEIREELASDTSDFARSEEDGWLYDEN